MTRASHNVIERNRTGTAINPDAAEALAEVTTSTPPSTSGDGRLISKVRNAYSEEGILLGHLAPPEKAGRVKNASRRALLLDKMGERLAFERSGVRLYEALIAKYDAPMPIGPGKAGPPRAELEGICADEHEHFELMHEAIVELGGDPTATTPAADVGATIAAGLPKVLLDPRSTFAQCLDAILVAELTDSEGWQLLVELAEAEDLDELAERFGAARDKEAEHLATVRDWVSSAALAGGSPRVHG
jgi:hypothetical protein